MNTNDISNSAVALDTYIDILKELGANDSNLLRRRTFLNALLKELDQLPKTEKVYGAVVEDRLKSFSQEETRHFFQTTARDFYHFWINDLQKVQTLISNQELSVIPFRITIPGPLDELIQASKIFSQNHILLGFHDYNDMLKQSNLSDVQIEKRTDWVCLVLYTMSEFESTTDNFRAAAEAVSLKLDNNIQRQSFFVTIGEFYPFWINAMKSL